MTNACFKAIKVKKHSNTIRPTIGILSGLVIIVQTCSIVRPIKMLETTDFTDYTDFGLIKPTDYFSVSEENEASDSDTRTFPYESFAV